MMKPYSREPIPTLARFIFGIIMVSYVIPLSADDSFPKITPETSLSEQQVKDALRNSEYELNYGKKELEPMLEKLGPGHPQVVRFKSALSAIHEVHVVKQQLLPLLVGPRDEKKQEEISQLVKALDLRNQELNTRVAQLDAEKAKVLADNSKDAHSYFAKEQQRMAAMRQEFELERQKFELERQKLAAHQRALEEEAKAMAQQQHERALPPLENAELKIFSLEHVQALSAANAIETLFGTGAMRVAVDLQTNSLIVLGKQESLKVVEALLMNLDQKQAKDGDKKQPQPSKEEAKQSLLLRLFWLVDELPEGEGTDPIEVLPASVVRAMNKLGLKKPKLVMQTVNSLAAGGNDAAQFSADAPAVLFKRNALLKYAGKVTLSDADKPAVTMQVDVMGEGLNCQLQGSMAMPLGHYMVLGTANSVVPEMAPAVDAGPQPGPDTPGGEFGPGGPGGEFGPGDPGGFGRLGPGRLAAEQPQSPVKLSTTRFAFVVQVIQAESYAPED